MASTSRMLALLSLLQTRRDWPGQVLAERLDVSPRTVRRDVERLRELGYRISAAKGPDGGYRLAAGSELPPLLFDDEQAVAIAVALQNAPASGVDIAEAGERALATVRQVMPSRLRHRVDGIRFIGTASPVRVDPTVLEAITGTVRERKVLRFDYEGSDSPRRVEPHAVVAQHGRWYLVAWDIDRDDWRSFRLDRLTPRTPTGPSFIPRALPTGSAAGFLAARFKGAEDEDRWPCVGEIEVDLPVGKVAPFVGDGILQDLTATSCKLTLGSWSWMGVLALVARFDAPFRILGPSALRDEADRLAQRLVESQR